MTSSDHEVTLRLVNDMPDEKLFAGHRWVVTDMPTRLRESVWSLDISAGPRSSHGLHGWRFQVTNQDGLSCVFDVFGGEGSWHVQRAYS
jgi:hypothetical protein